MTASKYIKERGLPSLAYVAKRVNKSSNTLNAWYRDNRPLFEAVVGGVLLIREKERFFICAPNSYLLQCRQSHDDLTVGDSKRIGEFLHSIW